MNKVLGLVVAMVMAVAFVGCVSRTCAQNNDDTCTTSYGFAGVPIPFLPR